MADFVGQYRGQLGFVIQVDHEATVHVNVAAGKGVGVDVSVVDNGEDIGDVRAVAVRGEVQWVTKGDRKGNRFSGAGIKFRRLSQRSKRLLDHFLTSGDAKLHYAL